MFLTSCRKTTSIILLIICLSLITLSPARAENIAILSEYLQRYTSEVIIEGLGLNQRVQIFEYSNSENQCRNYKLLAEGHFIGTGACADVFKLNIFDRVNGVTSARAALKVVHDQEEFDEEVEGLHVQKAVLGEYAVNFGSFEGRLKRNNNLIDRHGFILMDLGISDMDKMPLYWPVFSIFHERLLFDVNEILARIQHVEKNPIMMDTHYGMQPHVLQDSSLDNFIVKFGLPPDPIIRFLASDLAPMPREMISGSTVYIFLNNLGARFVLDIDDSDPTSIHILDILPR